MNLTKLDTVFSQFIRRKYADDRGLVQCYTCGQWMHWKSADCGHYLKRGNLATRFSEMNCRPQCKDCNQFKDGKVDIFRKKLLQEYGAYALLELEHESKNEIHLMQFEIDELVEVYKDKIKKL